MNPAPNPIFKNAHLVHNIADFLEPAEVSALARNTKPLLPSRSAFSAINLHCKNTKKAIENIKSFDDFNEVMGRIRILKNACDEARLPNDRYLKPLLDELITSRSRLNSYDLQSSNQALIDFMHESNVSTSLNTLVRYFEISRAIDIDLEKVTQIADKTNHLLSHSAIASLIYAYGHSLPIDKFFWLLDVLKKLDSSCSITMERLIDAMVVIPKERITTAFNGIIDILKNWGAHSLRNLPQLLDALQLLPEAQRETAFNHIMDISTTWDSDTANAMYKFIIHIPDLPHDQRTQAFLKIVDTLKNCDSPYWNATAELTAQIKSLPADKKTEATQRLEDLSKKM